MVSTVKLVKSKLVKRNSGCYYYLVILGLPVVPMATKAKEGLFEKRAEKFKLPQQKKKYRIVVVGRTIAA